MHFSANITDETKASKVNRSEVVLFSIFILLYAVGMRKGKMEGYFWILKEKLQVKHSNRP